MSRQILSLEMPESTSYELFQSVQVFYRRILLHIDFRQLPINLDTRKSAGKGSFCLDKRERV